MLIPPSLSGSRLDTVSTVCFDEIPSRAVAAKLIQTGLLTLNGKNAKPSQKVKSTDTLEFDPTVLKVSTHLSGDPHPQSPQTPMDLPILFEDDHILVVDKPAGLVCHPGAGNHQTTLASLVLDHCGVTLPSLGSPDRAGLVHRLDKDTSGVMVIAKSQVALTGLAQDFSHHRHKREYEALTITHSHSPLPPRVETQHGRHPTQRVKFAVLAAPQGKRAAMNTSIATSYVNGKFAKIRCTLETGRTHQIRVQLSHFGFGILGDTLYNAFPNGKSPLHQKKIKPLATRQMLHARLLGFKHPHTHDYVEFFTEPPSDFKTLETLLESITC